MSDRMLPMPDDALDLRLADLAGAIAFPPTPELAGAVAARLRTTAPPLAPMRRTAGRSLRRSLLLAAALLLVIVGGVLAVRLGLELLDIRFGAVPTLSPSPTAITTSPGALPTSSGPLGGSLLLGRQVTLDDVLEISSYRVLVPATLGPPDVVYVGGPSLRSQVAFVYAPRDGIPFSGLLGGAGLLITQNRGEMDDGLAGKLLATGQATVEYVDIDGADGVWITGKPHVFWYFAPDGAVIEESRRFVGDTLAWERGGVLYRIEGDIEVDQALEIARSMR